MSLVSVVIPTYNSAHTLRRAIDSVLAQDHANVQIIVVNDGSTDDTLSVLASLGQQIEVVTQPNQGTGAARNAGIRAANGEYVAFLDADDEWYPHKLSRQIQVLEDCHNVGLVSAAARYVDEAGATLQVGNTSLEGDLLEKLLYNNPIVTSSVLLRHSCLVGMEPLFRPDLPSSEDWDLWIRLSARYAFLVSSEVLVKYHVTETSITHRHHPIQHWRDVYKSIYAGLLEDPLLSETVKHHWSHLQANVHFLAGRRYFKEGQVWEARREIARAVIASPTRIRWANALVRLVAPPAALQFLRRLRVSLARQKQDTDPAREAPD